MTKGGKTDTGTSVETFWHNLTKDLGRDGKVNEDLHEIQRYTNEWGTDMVKVIDKVTGQTVTMPAIEYDAWAQSTSEARKKAGELKDEVDKLEERLSKLKGGEYSAEWLYNMAVKYNVSLQGVGLGGMEALVDVQKNGGGNIRGQERLEAAQGSVSGGLQEQINKQIEQLLGVPEGTVSIDKTIPVNVEVQVDSQIATKAATTFSISFTQEVGNQFAASPIDGTGVVSQFTAIGESAAAEFLRAFNSAVSVANLRTAGGSQSSDGQIYSDAGTTPQVATSNQTVEVSYTADTSAFDAAVTALQNTLGTLTRTTYMTHVTLDHVNLDTELTGVNTALQTFADTTFNATVGIDSVQMYGELYGVNAALDSYDARVVNATVGIVDFASGALQNIINKLDSINGRVVTTYTQTTQLGNANTPAPYATGGVVDSPLQLVGERGPELTTLPQGTRVQSSARTMNMLRGALKPDENNVELASIFRDIARETSGGDTVQNSGNTTITIQNVHITNDQDGQAFFESMDRWAGRRNQLANRGQIPVEGASNF